MNCKLCLGEGIYRGITGQQNFCFCKAGRAREAAALFAPERLSTMSRPEQIAWLVRRNLEAYAAKNGYGPTLQHLCGIASVALMVALKREGYPVYVADGSVDYAYHVWVVHNRKILDLTFTQFESKAPRVFVSKIKNGRHRQEAIYRKPQRLASTFSQMLWDRHVNRLADIG